MFSREQYMNNECSHHDYYCQFATSGVKCFVEATYSPEKIRECFSRDTHLNNLGNGWVKKFDEMTKSIADQIADVNFKLNGQRVYSLSDGTCAIKAYMLVYAEIPM